MTMLHSGDRRLRTPRRGARSQGRSSRTGALLKGLGTPKAILGLVLLYLAVMYLLIYAVDVQDAFGLRSRMLALDMNGPAVWYQVFASRKLTSILQWALLAAATPIAGIMAGRLKESGRQGPGAFWSLISVALALTLMGDGGNFHDIVVSYGSDLFPEYATLITIVVRLCLFGGISAILAYALVVHGRSVWGTAGFRPFIVMAYAAAALGAFSDVSTWIGFYEAAGLFVHNTLAQGQLVLFPTHTLASQAGLFMDSVWEESLELFSYAAFLAAALVYRNAMRSSRPAADPEEAAAPARPPA